MKKHVTVTHFTMKIILRTCLYITCNKKILFVKKYFSLLLGIHRLLHSCCFLNSNTAITWQLTETARTLQAQWWQICGEAWVWGQRNMSQQLWWYRGKRAGLWYWARLGCWISPCYGPFSRGTHFETYESFISLIFQFFSGPR
jgi:hypothetical protein